MKSIVLFLLCAVILACSIYGVFHAVLVEEQAACTYYNSPELPMWCKEMRDSQK